MLMGLSLYLSRNLRSKLAPKVNTPRGTPTDNVTDATLILLDAVILLLREHKDS